MRRARSHSGSSAPRPRAGWRRLGIDIGGTFTDFTLVGHDGETAVWKQDSDPERPERAVEVGLRELAKAMACSERELLVGIDIIVHGSTIATNTLIQRNGPRLGLLCTKGFRDVLYFRDGFKWDRFNHHLARPQDFVDRYLRLGVEERVGPDGTVVKRVSESDVRAAAARFRDAGVAAVAVGFLWSIVNPENERRAADLLRKALPGVHVVESAEVLPEIREWERTSATVLSAYVAPRLTSYLREFEKLLSRRGFRRKPLIMQNNGGCASVEEVIRRPVNMLASGPAAAPAAAQFYSERIGVSNLITVDMGGTSFDVCVVRDGRPAMSRQIQVENQPIGVSGVEVHSIGAGGGSVAWIDSGGALRVGPRSAGARPGPACYGAGGLEPTVTDATVVLGYLAPSAFLGGRRSLRADVAKDVIQREIGDPLGLDAVEAAAGIIEVVTSNMVGGIRAVSVERGIDPRDFTLVCGGGAGGVHAGMLARQLGIESVIIPREASTFCSFGMTVTDVKHDYVRSLHCTKETISLEKVAALFAELEAEARARLEHDGFARSSMVIDLSVDARYVGQLHELTIAVRGESGRAMATADDIIESFHAKHQQQFAYRLLDANVEFLHWRVTAHGLTHAKPPKQEATVERRVMQPAPSTKRRAYFGELGLPVVSVYGATELPDGAKICGPAIIEANTTTVVVQPKDSLTVGEGGYLTMEVTEASHRNTFS